MALLRKLDQVSYGSSPIGSDVCTSAAQIYFTLCSWRIEIVREIARKEVIVWTDISHLWTCTYFYCVAPGHTVLFCNVLHHTFVMYIYIYIYTHTYIYIYTCGLAHSFTTLRTVLSCSVLHHTFVLKYKYV